MEVEQFQVEACEEVARLNQAASDNMAPPQTLSTARLEALIERGGQFEFHVPELDTLKLALQQNQWVAETREKLRLEMQTVDGLKAMAKQGTNLMHGSTGVFIVPPKYMYSKCNYIYSTWRHCMCVVNHLAIHVHVYIVA